MSRAKFTGSHISTIKPEGTFIVFQVFSDGKDKLWVGWSENIIPYLTIEILDTFIQCTKESFYRTRPDLRQQ